MNNICTAKRPARISRIPLSDVASSDSFVRNIDFKGNALSSLALCHLADIKFGVLAVFLHKTLIELSVHVHIIIGQLHVS